MSNLDFHWKTFDILNRWISQADAKAVALLSANGVVAGIVFLHLDKILVGLQPSALLFDLAALGLACLLCSFFFAIRCVLPSISHGEAKSVTYFHHIAQLSEEEYEAKLDDVLNTPDGTKKELIYQIWANSKVASRKFRCIFLSIISLISALSLLMLTGFFYYVFYN